MGERKRIMLNTLDFGSRGPTIQMAGRALRRKPENMAPYAQIVQNEDAKWPFTRVASAERRFAMDNDIWEDRDMVSDKIAAAIDSSIMAMPRL
jgi:hypothetical protein